MGCWGKQAIAQSYDYEENSIYAFNFIKYTNWPQKKTKIKIGIIGETPLEQTLSKLYSKKKAGDVAYEVSRISVDECRQADVIIVAERAWGKVKEISAMTAGLPILIITERAQMGGQGACISFYIDEDNEFKTGYQVSMRNYRKRGLKPGVQIQNNGALMR